jgi:hypothetical protein
MDIYVVRTNLGELRLSYDTWLPDGWVVIGKIKLEKDNDE